MSEIEKKIPFILQVMLWIIPINIYMIGDGLGAGIQWALFRYQQAFINDQLVTSIFGFNREIQWVFTSVLTGKSAIAVLFWGCGIFFLLIGTFLITLATIQKVFPLYKKTAIMNTISACSFGFSIIFYYGITFQGPAGMAIPFGIPIILGVSYYQYHGNVPLPESDDETDGDDK